MCRCQRQLPHNHVRHARHCSQLLGITCLSLAKTQANSIQLKLLIEQLSQKSALVVDASLGALLAVDCGHETPKIHV